MVEAGVSGDVNVLLQFCDRLLAEAVWFVSSIIVPEVDHMRRWIIETKETFLETSVISY